jgi:hypothetical protein
VNIRKDAKFAFFQKKWRVGNVFLDSLGKWTYKSPVFLGENQEFSIFWPKNRAFFPITTGLIVHFPGLLEFSSTSLRIFSSRFFISL